MVGSSESQKTTSELLHLAFGGSSYSRGKVTLTSEEIQHLLSRSSPDEQKDIHNTLKKCTSFVTRESDIPRTALVVGGMYLAYTKLVPAVFNYRPKKMWPLYAVAAFMVGDTAVANLFGMSVCRLEVNPKIAKLWMKYGDAELTTNYAALAGHAHGNPDSYEASEAQETSRLVRLALGGSGVSQGTLTLTPEEIQQLLRRISSDEHMDIHDTLMGCTLKASVARSSEIPCIIFNLGLAYAAHTWLPAKYFFGPLKNLKAAPLPVAMAVVLIACAITAYQMRSAYGMDKCKERVQPKIAHLWRKYGGAESTTNYEPLPNRNRGGTSGSPRERLEKNGN